MKKLRVGDIVCIEWLDICTDLRVEKEKIYRVKNLKDLMVKTTSYGKILRIKNGVILIVHENSQPEVDYTTIPGSLIIDFKILKKK